MTSPRRDPQIGWPEVVVLPVTYLCNAHCDMCALGDLNQRDQLSDEHLLRVFADPAVNATLRAINFTGGEPTLRRDLPELVDRLLEVCPNLESVSLNSNGMLRPSAKIITRVIETVRRHGKKLYLFISLDGVGRLHDEIRGVAGAFEKTVRTIDAIREQGFPPGVLRMGVSATATWKNIDHLGDVLDFAVDRGLQVSFTFPMTTDVYMNNMDRVSRFTADRELVERFAMFLARLSASPEHVSPPMSFYRSLQETLRGGRRSAPCVFRRGGFFLEPNGNMLPCWRSGELQFGSLAEQSFSDVWFGEQRRSIVASIEEKYCVSCPSPCYVGFPSELAAPTPVDRSG